MKKTRSLCFSVLHGSNVYYWNSASDIEDVRSGKKFWAMKVECNVFTLSHFKLYVENAPQIPDVEWPHDLVSIDEFQSNECMESADIINSEMEKMTVYYAFLFDTTRIEKGKTLRMVVENENIVQNDSDIEHAVCGLVKTLSDLNNSGWYLSGIDLNRIHISNDDSKKIILDFSTLFRRICMDDRYCYEQKKNPMEFMEPALGKGLILGPDIQTQNYSIAATIFYVLVGLHPYDGNHVMGGGKAYGKRLLTVYSEWMRFPVFIFDPTDTANSIGYFEEDKKYIESWKSLPDSIKDMFCRSLSKNCAERMDGCVPCTPEEWESEFRRLGWGNAS